MKKTLSTWEIAGMLERDNNAVWSRLGAKVLAEYLQRREEETGVEEEFCAADIRSEFAEYTPDELLENYNYIFSLAELEEFAAAGATTEDVAEAISDALKLQTVVLEVGDRQSYIVEAF